MTNDDRIQYIVLTIDPAADETASELRPGARSVVDRFAQVDVQIGHDPGRLTEGGRMMLTEPAAREIILALLMAAGYVEELVKGDTRRRRVRIVLQGSHPLAEELRRQFAG